MISCERLKKRLSSTLFTNIFCFDSVSSTNTVALEKAHDDPSREFVILSDTQTGGKGRHGRTWFSPAGKNSYLSLVLRPHIKISDASMLSILSGVAVCEALRDISGIPIRIKWPNDLVFENRKLGGILIETRTEHSLVTIGVIGIGLNISLENDDLPEDLRGNATSLFIETSKSFKREDIVLKVLEHISDHYRRLFVPSGGTAVRTIDPDAKKQCIDRWKKLDTVLGKKISVTTSQGKVSGQAVDIDEAGMLDILTNEGKKIKIHTGDISFL